MDSFPVFSLVVICVISVSFTLCLWRLLQTLDCVTGKGVRAHDRDRRDLYQWIERIMERNMVPPDKAIDTVQIHAQERVNQVRSDGATERENASRENGAKPRRPEQEKVLIAPLEESPYT